MASKAGCPANLSGCPGISELLPTLAAEAAQQWTGQFNPRSVDLESLSSLYQKAM
jgi:alcohol dehydrogenase